VSEQPKDKGDETALFLSLSALTVVAGAFDAVAFLRLGHVFVANMTGNVAFLGLALAGASGFSVLTALAALAAFVTGAAIAGRLPALTPGRTLRRAAACEAVLGSAATVVAVVSTGPAARYTMTVLLALAMGGQTATVRRLAVPDMTTTVLTRTLTGLAVDTPDLRQPGSHAVRRIAAVAAMVAGAAGGALLVFDASTGWALGTASAVLGGVAVASRQ